MHIIRTDWFLVKKALKREPYIIIIRKLLFIIINYDEFEFPIWLNINYNAKF
jgi:hypothetical protein